jgi:hypothetical protein
LTLNPQGNTGYNAAGQDSEMRAEDRWVERSMGDAEQMNDDEGWNGPGKIDRSGDYRAVSTNP